MIRHHFIVPLFFFFALLTACVPLRPAAVAEQQNNPVQRLADSILQIGLDHEALYTIIGRIKPMSSVLTIGYHVAVADSSRKWQQHALDLPGKQAQLDSIIRIQRAVNAMQIPGIRFFMIPYKHTHGSRRLLQVYAARVSLIDSLMSAKAAFFGQFGFVPGTDPAVIANTVEFEEQSLRQRAYGYLFGYPDHAVDFFMASTRGEAEGRDFLARDFFQIPTFSGETGHFVYAVPKGYQPREQPDSILYRRAVQELERYRQRRGDFINPDSSLRTQELVKSLSTN